MILIGAVFIVLSWVAGTQFRSAAMAAQVKSLSRVIEVASNEVQREMLAYAINLGSGLNSDNQLNSGFQHFIHGGSKQRFVTILNDPFITGFANYDKVELRKLRIYDLELRPLVQSTEGAGNVPFRLPTFLYNQAILREGVNRLKAISGLWVSGKEPFYSVLLPVGGLRIEGYLEIVFNPRVNFARVSEITGMPVTIHTDYDHLTGEHHNSTDDQHLPIEYVLEGDDGEEVFHLVGIENIDKLSSDMMYTQIVTITEFLIFIFITLLVALWHLRLGLFIPLHNLLQGIESYSDGNLETKIQSSGLKEMRTLADTFNDMMARIRDDILTLERYSTIDGLTGISNRRYFETCIAHEWHRAMRLYSEVSLIFIDIDFFKKYNDHYGHLNGDDCIRKVARTIGDMAKRSTDVSARYGGEEFVVLLPDTELAHAIHLAQTIKYAVSELNLEHAASEVSDNVTLSIGVATMRPQPQQAPTLLIEAADKALYQAKNEGRDRIVVAPKTIVP